MSVLPSCSVTAGPYAERRDDGPYYVPADLWPWYVDADPSPAEKAAYVASGLTITERVERDVPRLIVGRGDRPDEHLSGGGTLTVSEFRHLSGARDYREWLHRERVDIAWRARKAAPMQARIDARAEASRCAVCGVHGSPLPVAPGQPYADRIAQVRDCVDHAPLLAVRLVERLALLDGRRRLDDGRSVEQAVDETVDVLLADVEADVAS